MPSRVSRIIPCPASIQAPGEGGKPSLPGGSAYRLRYSARDTTPGSSRGGLPARSGLGGFVAAGGEAFEEFAGGFVVGGLRHEFAPEGLGEQGGDELPDLSAGSSDAGFEAAGEGEGAFARQTISSSFFNRGIGRTTCYHPCAPKILIANAMGAALRLLVAYR